MMISNRFFPENPASVNRPSVWNVRLLIAILLGSMGVHFAIYCASKSALLYPRPTMGQPSVYTEPTPETLGNNTQFLLGRLSIGPFQPETQLLPERLSHTTHQPGKTLPAERLITMYQFRGRLGNQMFEYASLKGLARLTKRTAVLTHCPSFLDETFQNLTACAEPKLTRGQVSHWHRIKERRKNVAASISAVVNSKHSNISISMYYQCPLYFDHVLDEIRNEFVFREKHTELAHNLLRNITPKSWSKGSFVRVAIHIRRGDMATKHWQEFGVVFPPKSFFKNAIELFRNKYKRVLFVIGSDQLDWCVPYFKQFDGTFAFLPRQPYYIDMATLSQCDHAITSMGTFSWWMGWLVKGITVYYKGYARPNSWIALKWKENEYIPKKEEFNNWIALM